MLSFISSPLRAERKQPSLDEVGVVIRRQQRRRDWRNQLAAMFLTAVSVSSLTACAGRPLLTESAPADPFLESGSAATGTFSGLSRMGGKRSAQSGANSTQDADESVAQQNNSWQKNARRTSGHIQQASGEFESTTDELDFEAAAPDLDAESPELAFAGDGTAVAIDEAANVAGIPAALPVANGVLPESPSIDDCLEMPPGGIDCPPVPREYCPPDTSLPNCVACSTPVSDSRQYPDEYICDGGDRGESAYHEGFEIRGLDPQDTVAKFRGADGKSRVKASNRVCIYSPRFAAVTNISNVAEGNLTDRAAGVLMLAKNGTFNNRTGVTAQEQIVPAQRLVTRARGSAMQTRNRARAVDLVVSPITADLTISQLSFVGLLQTGMLEKVDRVVVADHAKAAIAWSQSQNPVLAATTLAGTEVRTSVIAGNMQGLEKRGATGLRIVKLADKTAAAVGDEITFMLRYDNLGDEAVSEVVLSDNLISRLEYVDGSATSDRPAKFRNLDNRNGSTIVQWELEEPLPAKSGGVVTFKAVVK